MRTISLTLVLVLSAGSISAQTTLNPDISAIARFLMYADDSSGKLRRPEMAFEELELVVAGYLNPYARADIAFAVQGPDVEKARLGLEEAYVTILRGLPADLNLRIGKYRAEFGKLNMLHPHAWPFITRPASAEQFLGEEGVNDIGLSVSALLPTGDVYTRLTADLLRGAVVGEATGIEDTASIGPFYAATTRLSSFFTLGDDSDLEVGLSAYTGIHDPYRRERFWYVNLDFKYKYKPSAYTALTVQGEYLGNFRKASQDRSHLPFADAVGRPETRTINTSGFYLFADYQFLKTYSVGARVDWSESPYSADDRTAGGAVFFGYYPVEETLGVRLQYQHQAARHAGESRSVNLIAAQLLFSLGPHKAHPF